MTESQKIVGEMVIDAVENESVSGLREKLAGFFGKNPKEDRNGFLSGVKLAAAYGPWTDFGEPPILCLMDDGWQDWIKDAAIDALHDEDADLEEELMDADLAFDGVFGSEFGFSVEIEATDALSLLKGMGVTEVMGTKASPIPKP